jgi:hypothetical protein
MKTVLVFDPPMCCSSGVCGPAVDSKLLRFATNLHWLANHGIRVERFNLSQQPQAFAANATVRATLQAEGNDCLPLILVDGKIASRGLYPDRKHLADFTGLAEQFAAESGIETAGSLPVVQG